MVVFQIKKDSTEPALAVQLVDANSSGIDLSTGSYIQFMLSSNDNTFTAILSGTAVITGSTTGNVEYRWTASDTDRSGTFLGEFMTVFNDNSILKLPSDHSLFIKINEDYDGV